LDVLSLRSKAINCLQQAEGFLTEAAGGLKNQSRKEALLSSKKLLILAMLVRVAVGVGWRG
jgi:hypothetical protein